MGRRTWEGVLGSEADKEGGREGRKEGGREGGREGEREGGRGEMKAVVTSIILRDLRRISLFYSELHWGASASGTIHRTRELSTTVRQRHYPYQGICSGCY